MNPPAAKRYPYDQWAPDARALDIVGDKWTLLIIRDLSAGARRFVQLQRTLPGISTEQLRSRLGSMVAAGLVTRKRYRESPPRVDYELTPRGEALLPVVAALAVWGYDWAWTDPRVPEVIDIAAILRIAPGLARLPGTLSGVAELTVEVDAATTSRTTLTVSDGRMSIRESATPDADVRITGAQADWIDALGPGGDRAGLEIDGDRRLATLLLDAIAASRGRSDDAAGGLAGA